MNSPKLLISLRKESIESDNMPRNKGIKEHRIRIDDVEALVLRQAIMFRLKNDVSLTKDEPTWKLLNELYTRLAHLKPGPPKGIPIKKSEARKL